MTDLKITQQKLEDQQILLNIEVPEERVDKAMHTMAKKLARQLRIPGFRPGKAPYHVVVARIGREAMLEEVADEIGQDIFKEALEVTEIEPYGQANLKDVTFDPLVYQIEIPQPPEVEPGDYRSLRVPYEAPGDEATDQAYQEQIDAIREQHKTWVPVERPIEYGDLVTISLKVTVDDEVVLENDDWDVMPDEEDYTLVPEFDAAFIGMSVGETKTFMANFPEDADNPWAGQQGTFEIEIKGIKSEELPELTDDLAQELGGYETFDALKQDILDHVTQHLSNDAESEYLATVLEAMVEAATLSYPPIALENEIDILISERESFYRAYGFESTEELLEVQGITMAEYREELRPAAQSRLERQLVLDAIAEREQFEVSDYELEQYLLKVVGQDPEQFKTMLKQTATNDEYREFISVFVKREKAEDLMLAIARDEEVPAPGEHPVEEAPETEEEALVDSDGDLEDVVAESTGEEIVPEAEPEEESLVEEESEAAIQPDDEPEATLETSEPDPDISDS